MLRAGARIFVGYIAACAVAILGASGTLMVLEPNYSPSMADWAWMAWPIGLLAWGGIPLATIGELMAWRSIFTYLIIGVCTSLIGVATLVTIGDLGTLKAQGVAAFLSEFLSGIRGSGPLFLFSLPAAMAGGAGYWLVAGRHAGT